MQSAKEQQQDEILKIIFNHEGDVDGWGLIRFLEKIGFDVYSISDADELPDAILAHYQNRDGSYDTARAATDMAKYGPITGDIQAAQLVA